MTTPKKRNNKAIRKEMRKMMAELIKQAPRTAKALAANKGLLVLLDSRDINTVVKWEECIWEPE